MPIRRLPGLSTGIELAPELFRQAFTALRALPDFLGELLAERAGESLADLRLGFAALELCVFAGLRSCHEFIGSSSHLCGHIAKTTAETGATASFGPCWWLATRGLMAVSARIA